MELSCAPVLRRKLSAFTTGALDKGPAGPGLELLTSRGAQCQQGLQPGALQMLWPYFHNLQPPPLRLRPRDCSSLAADAAGKSCASRLGLANAGCGSTGYIAPTPQGTAARGPGRRGVASFA